MRTRLRGLSFRVKIILAFCTILLINVLVTGVAFYLFAGRSTVEQYERNSRDMAQQIELYLGDKIENMTQRINALGNNLSFVDPMRTFLMEDTVEYDPILAGSIARMFAEIEAGDDFIDSIFVSTEKGLFDDYLLTRNRLVGFEDTEMYRYMQKHPEENVAWFPAMQCPLYEDSDQVIPVVYRKRIANKDVFFVIQISQSALADYLARAYASLEVAFIVDGQGKTVLPFSEAAGQIPEELICWPQEKTSQQLTLEGHRYLAARAEVKASGWQVYLLTPVDSMLGSLHRLRIFLLAENLVMLALCACAILWGAQRMTASLEALARTMSAAANEDYRAEFQYPYPDEIGQVAQSYNGMLAQIRRHIRALEEEKQRVQEIQRQKRKAELLALQSQINPHFLYNTLNMITWQAVDAGAEEISIISTALGKYFRISLSRGREIIPLGDEVGHVRSYLEIQKIRYKEKLNYTVDLPTKLECVPIIRLILQPLVENALYHGIKPKKEGGIIRVAIRQKEKDIELMVEDDGAGIGQERLDYLNERLKNGEVDDGSGYGIYNVNSRLRLYYGEQYGLRLCHTPGGGIRSVLTIPVTEGEEEANDKNYYRGG